MMNLDRIRVWGLVLPLLLVFAACAEERGAEPDTSGAAPEAPAADTSARAAAPPAARINLNTASEDEFRTIPGVGDRMVGEFIEYRPYRSIRQFRREIGKYVDEQQVAAYEQYLFVPIDPNESDAETIRQIPGVDEQEAADLVAGRPYASADAFLEKLTGYVAADELSVARSYLSAP